jgi:hypothetical protein
MSELIDRERLKEVLKRNFGEIGGADVLRQLIDAQPTVDSVVHGHWIDLGEHGDSNWQCDGRGRSWYLFKCSHCGNKITDMKYPYCPNCGADMRGDQKGLNAKDIQ